MSSLIIKEIITSYPKDFNTCLKQGFITQGVCDRIVLISIDFDRKFD